MKDRDYYVEFYETLDFILREYISKLQTMYPSSLLVGVHDASVPITTFLFLVLNKYKSEYNTWRKTGVSQKEAVGRMSSKLESYNDSKLILDVSLANYNVMQHPWYKTLIPYKGRLLIYVFNECQLLYLTPLITALNQPVLLLSEYDLPEGVDLPDYVTAITFKFTKVRICANSFVESKFPLVYHYFNSLDILIQILSPRGILILEGYHHQEKVLAIVGHSYGIPSIGIQYGCSDLFHTIFRELPFSYYFTWGEDFSKQWEMYSTLTEFHSVGYLCSVNESDKRTKRCITFFLQAPDYLSDDTYSRNLLQLVENTAIAFPQLSVLVREHPEYRVDKQTIKKWQQLSNVELVTDEEIVTVFCKTQILISHFSSALLEGLIHGCIPLVYNPTANFEYFSVIAKNGWGEIVTDQECFLQSVKLIIEEADQFRNTIALYQSALFSNVGCDAIQMAVRLINQLVMPCDYLRVATVPRLHVGCGPFPMEGWLNVDKFVQSRMVSYMDASQIYPFPDKTFCFIYAEHLFEHLTLDGALNMLKECYRVLRPQGVLRLSMPDLEFLIQLYLHPEKEVHRKYIDWSIRQFMPEVVNLYSEGDFHAMYVLNNFYRAWGHQLIYDKQGIARLLSECHFQDIRFCHSEDSTHDLLRGINQHQYSIPEWADKLETMVVEATKGG